ncbi:MAG: cytochrome c oxidase subunit 3 [Acidobacteria bacterium]|nr:cytochrome c oxidase subunit 3 [Acidobacteriota bacterium]
MSQATETETAAVLEWSGPAGSPMAVPWNKLMMWLFIITDGLLFAGFLSGYGFARLSSPAWPDQRQVFHLSLIALMTFILISSSATMASAVGAALRGRRGSVLRFLLLTLLGGLAFLGLQAYEWSTFIQEGARLYSNPWGVPQFSAYFFMITGFHGSHVLTGAVILSITAARWARGGGSAEGVELAGLYWHFVDLVWVFIFTLFYLI